MRRLVACSTTVYLRSCEACLFLAMHAPTCMRAVAVLTILCSLLGAPGGS